MKPEILQTISQIVVFLGIILTAIGGYGHFHYGKKIEKNREITIDTKLDSIPSSINANNKENTDKVLDAIGEVKLSIDEIAATDGSNIKIINGGIQSIPVIFFNYFFICYRLCNNSLFKQSHK
ncbi:hypothetical protein [Sunxiuqinia indica]|uniref:hypothetical protein n=1 Tax=Sunxiuqinia indica TaxID=2692584 RepID=UPI0013572B29|nr:hypothetical protein [Sunxiuqinia indica]